MRLALRGFTVVNFDYRLAPEHKYPAPVEDACKVLFWMQQRSEEYFMDLNNVFTVGDSAGGQISFQLLTLLTNPEYAKLFPFPVPEDFTVRGCGMNCGCYFLPFSRLLKPKTMGPLFEAYFPEDYLPLIPQFKAQKFITKDFPPAFVMSAQNDYLRFMAAPLHRILKKKGVESVLKIYGTKAQKEIGHVFHLNCHCELADQCNDEQTAFFKAHIQ
jgi:acetyl esterase/lipase